MDFSHFRKNVHSAGTRVEKRVDFMHLRLIFLLTGLLTIITVGWSADQHKTHFVTAPAAITDTDPLDVVHRYTSSITSIESSADTVRVLALRAEFVKDDLQTTTGDGTFDLSNNSSYLIDRPPHNRTYFQHQLLALRNYFRTVSKGQLVIESDVLPFGENEAYQLSHNMVYYSGEEDEEKQKQRWAELLRDALTAAEENDDPDFDAYDVYIVFHAGVGADISLDFDPTPFDIQSAFIDFETLKETIGTDDPGFTGIEVGDTVIKEGIILPETQNQEDVNLGLLGTSTLMMGSQLGMPSLFDTETGRAGIGQWGLMDQGSFNYNGLVPAEPCAWMKIYMGWDEPIVHSNLKEALIGTAHTKSVPHIIKVPINANEYFLLENRQRDPNGDRYGFGRDVQGNRIQFDSTFSISAESGLGVVVRVDEYDYGLPGSGILIWHIDENVIRANLESNTINNNPEHRGVDLIECDGPQDIGQQYTMFTAGYGTENGDYWDPYWNDNISHKYVNGQKPVELSPTSIPNSNAYGHADSHIRIHNFSAKDTLMSCSISSDIYKPGFPQLLNTECGEGALTFTYVQDEPVLIAVGLNGDVFGWHIDGRKLIPNDETITVSDYAGRETTFELARMTSVEHPVSRPPLMQDFNDDGVDDIWIVDDGGTLTVWSFTDTDKNGQADLLASLDIDDTPTAGPVSSDDMPTAGFTSSIEILVGTNNGVVYFISKENASLNIHKTLDVANGQINGVNAFSSSAGKLLAVTTDNGFVSFYRKQQDTYKHLWQKKIAVMGVTLTPLFADLTEKNEPLPFAVVADNGEVTFLSYEGDIVNEMRGYQDFGSTSAPAIQDVNADGRPELLFISSTKLAAYQWGSGVPVLNFPVEFTINEMSQTQLAAPVTQKDGSVYFASPDGMIYGYNGDGPIKSEQFSGPLSVSATLQTTPLILENNENKQGGLFAISSDGFLYGWDIPLSAPGWQKYGNDPANTFQSRSTKPGPDPNPSASGNVMPANRVFCYPNPAAEGFTNIRYSLVENVSNVSIRIYDVAGELVTELKNNAVTPGDHETVWNIGEVQSGAYLARVEAKTASGNNVKFIKIAVIK